MSKTIDLDAAIAAIMSEPSEVRYPVYYAEKLKRLSTVPQEMSAREYIKQQFRMCMTQSDGVKCEGCPLSPSVTGEYCDTYEVLHPDQAVAIVEKWAQEHPEERSEE